MPGHSRPKDGVASLAYVPGIHVFLLRSIKQDVDGRDKPGHDDFGYRPNFGATSAMNRAISSLTWLWGFSPRLK
jgi:hypothetical protein